MSPLKFWSAWLVANAFSITQGQTCSCASTNWYNSVRLPGLIVQNTCPEWPAVIKDFPVPGINATVPEVTGFLYISNRFVAANAGKNVAFQSYVSGIKRQDCTRSFVDQPIFATGWSIILLNRWYTYGPKGIPGRLIDGIMTDLSASWLYPVPDVSSNDTYRFFLTSGRTAIPTIPDVTLGRYPTLYNWAAKSVGTGGRGTSALNVNTVALLKDIRKTLTDNGWTDFQAGMVQTGDGLFPAVLKRLGDPQRVYAYYGRLTDGESARQLGFSTGDPLYFSRPNFYPKTSTEFMRPGFRYGAEIMTSTTSVISNREKFEWFPECRCSDMAYNPDQDNSPTLETSGNWTPISPSNLVNRNPIQLRECPDHIQYASLYAKCAAALLGDPVNVSNPKDRTDYGDYLASKMGETPVFKSMEPEGTVEKEDLDVDKMPSTPAYYDHAGNRLNPSTADVSDPFDAGTKFMVQGDAPSDWLILDRHVDVDVSDRIRPVYERMKALFTGYFSKGKEGVLPFFDVPGNYFDTPVGKEKPTLEKTVGTMTVTLKVERQEYFRQNWKLLNTWDKFVPFRDARVFVTRSLSRKQVPVTQIYEWLPGTGGATFLDHGWWASFEYAIFNNNNYGDATRIGTITFSEKVYDNAWGRNWNKDLWMTGDKNRSSSDKYDLASREAHTDLKDLSERDKESFPDKSDAMLKIAYYIAVSEGLDMAMKWVYQQRDKPYIYEGAKRVDNMAATKVSKQIALELYRSYVEWKRMMDILRDIRDTRRSLERSFSRFRQSGKMLFDYYGNLDYSKVRPTNMTILYPTRAIRYFDFATDNLAFDVKHFEFAAHAMALDVDRFLNGPGKSTIAYLNREFLSNLSTIDGENENQRQQNHAAYQGSLKAAGASEDRNSNYIRLSAVTRLVIQKTQNLQLKSLQASTSGLRNVLIAGQSDSRDWLTMSDYVTQNIAGTPGALMQSFDHRTPHPIAEQLTVGSLFNNDWVDDQVKDLAK